MSDAPLYCPYCGEEDLRPNEASHGAWECHSCARVFTVKFNGLLNLRAQSGEAGPATQLSKGVNR
jgi:transposase-like protein